MTSIAVTVRRYSLNVSANNRPAVSVAVRRYSLGVRVNNRPTVAVSVRRYSLNVNVCARPSDAYLQMLVEQYLETRQPYNSDTLADAGGVDVGKLYYAGPAHETFQEGALIRRLT